VDIVFADRRPHDHDETLERTWRLNGYVRASRHDRTVRDDHALIGMDPTKIGNRFHLNAGAFRRMNAGQGPPSREHLLWLKERATTRRAADCRPAVSVAARRER
jgi:hypothetical protein